VFNVAEESVVVLRDEAGEIRAFANICRHRGSVLCGEPSGNCRKIVCPYHQWTYDLHGRLVSARWMGDDFRPDDYPLLSLPVVKSPG
jgi:Rieske 2Fe-2S family protein